MIDIYDRAGNPITMERWAELVEQDTDFSYRRVAMNEIGPLVISTVWLGFDHGFMGQRCIFETKVFDPNHKAIDGDDLFARYATEAEALEGHKRIVQNVLNRTQKASS